ncbi:MAG: DRTGG domain-containing protein [Desulfobacterota bacterium]|jgi:predicted transcriptional regulator|nr:DRTGG domain-containing protein [Thermodesulfobacteriota bacterium]
MKLSELAKKTGLKSINPFKDKDFEGVYISDMVSDIITMGKPNALLLTLQTHKSLIATANLVDVAAIVFAKGKMPASDVVQLADKAGIALFVSELDTWTMASKLFELGIR